MKKAICDALKNLGIKEVILIRENDLGDQAIEFRGEDDTGAFLESMTNSDFSEQGL